MLRPVPCILLSLVFSGVFYFWGHSYEMITEAMWSAFDAMIARIAADPDARWAEIEDLFAAP